MKLIECKNSHNIYKVMKEVVDVSDKEIVANSVDAAFEKHVPQYEIDEDNNKVNIVVNHVMEEEHYIEWIMVEYKDMDITKYFKPDDKASLVVDYVPEMKLYSYCNKHGLWSVEV